MVDIYVLECEDGNVYVGKTTKGEKRLKQHIAGRGAEWTKMHKPKRVMQYYTNATDADERKVTDQMIKKYGAKKVRGAGLTKRKMTKKEVDNLNRKVGFTATKATNKSRKSTSGTKKKTGTYTCGRCGRQGHNRTQCYAKTNSAGKIITSKSSKPKKSVQATKKKATKRPSSSTKKASKPRSTTTKKKSVRKSTKKSSLSRSLSYRLGSRRR